MMLKKELRLNFQDRRKKTSPQDVLDASLAISNKLLELPIWDYQYFHLFLNSQGKKEIDTSFILTLLQGKDKEVIIPKVHGKALRHFLLMDSTVFKNNSWNIPEPVDGILVPPEKIEVVFLPLLAYDKSGYRVGYGKGYYDVFLSQCKPETIKIGLSMFEPVDTITDVETHDIAMDYCVTPTTIYSF